MTVLAAATPEAWLDAACTRWQLLLLDHANCEKKAASTALALIFAYPEHDRDNLLLARLAREELRHFEQVSRLMQSLAVPFERVQPGRYAGRLRAALRTHEPARRIDLLLVGALIEARSCERFRLLAPRLPTALGRFYSELEAAESRHQSLYLDLAAAGDPHWQPRLMELAAIEAELILAPDPLLRFHSGPPARASVSSA